MPITLEHYYIKLNEFPLSNWIKCCDGELEYTRIAKRGNSRADKEAWDILYNQYISKYGLGKLYKRQLEQMKKKANAELDYVITGDKFKLTIIEMETSRLEAMLSTAGTGITIEQSLIHLSKWLGYWIRTKDISVTEFFDMTKEYEKYIKANNGKENK